LSIESELERLRKNLSAEQKRGFDVNEGVLNLIYGFGETAWTVDSLFAQQAGDVRHPRLTQSLNVADGRSTLQTSSSVFVVDAAHVGMADLA